jgi:alpha-tubulin suppressor-like RCC1 family protein
VAGTARYRLVGTNQFFACGLDTDAHVHCWGYSYLGRDASAGIPMPVDPGRTYDTLSVQGWAACGLSAQAAHCWGVPYDSVRDVLYGAGQLIRIEVGAYEACGYTAEGNGNCWDEYSYDYATRASAHSRGFAARSASRKAPALHGGVTGNGFYCGLDADGSAWCWGSNEQGQLGDGTLRHSDEPVPVASDVRFTLLAAAVAGEIHRVCGIATDHTLFCWGDSFGAVPAAVLF